MASSPKEFGVNRYDPSLVSPAHHDHNQQDYFLSNLDHDVPGIDEILFCFNATPQRKNTNRPAEVILHALKKVLTVYYPLAGRLKISPEGRMYVQCTGEGAVFVEAYADCSLDDIGLDMTKPDFSIRRRLVYSIPGAGTNILLMPPLVAQVTTFKCGGFVLGLATNHILYDGMSVMECLNSWSEIARGVPLSVPPFLDRTLLRARSPLRIEFSHLERPKIENVTDSKEISEEKCPKIENVTASREISEGKAQYQYKYFPFSPEDVKKLKKLAMEDGTLLKCTSFQVLAAHVWKCRTKALRIPPDQPVLLLFVMDVRRRLEPPLPRGYFGNAIYSNISICSAGELLERGLSFAVGLIQKAMEMVTNRYLRSAIDYLELNRRALDVSTSFEDNIFEISSWSRLPFHTIDFGWGEPTQTGPACPPTDCVIFLSRDRGHEKIIEVQMGLPPRSMMLFEAYARV